MAVIKNWNNTNYSIPEAGNVNWPTLTNLLVAFTDYAQTTNKQKFAIRIATATPVTISALIDCIVVVDVASAAAVNLPAGVDGQIFVIIDGAGAANTNNITITPNGAETIQGAANYAISTNNGGVLLAFKTDNWFLISSFNTIVPRSDIAAGTANYVVINGPAGLLSEEQYLNRTRGGTGITSTATFPATGTITTDDGVSTFTNKTYDADGTGNVLSNIDDGNIKAGAAIAATKLADGSVDNTEFQRLGSAGTAGAGNLVTTDGTQTLTAKTIDSDNNVITNIVNADIKTGAAIDRAKIASGDSDVVLINGPMGAMSSEVTLSPARGGTGASNSPSATLIRSGAHSLTLTTSAPTSVTLPTSGTLTTLAGSEVFTNKTLTAPTITAPVITGGATLRGGLLLQNTSGSQPTLQLSEDPDNGTDKVTIQAPATLGGDYTLTLPTTDGDASQVLTTDGSGVLSWSSVATNSLTSAHLFVGNGSNIATDTAVTGDVTITNAGVTAIGSAKVTDAMLANGTALSVLGRSANSSGVKADIAAGSDGHVLRRSGTTLGFGTLVGSSVATASDSARGVVYGPLAITGQDSATNPMVNDTIYVLGSGTLTPTAGTYLVHYGASGNIDANTAIDEGYMTVYVRKSDNTATYASFITGLARCDTDDWFATAAQVTTLTFDGSTTIKVGGRLTWISGVIDSDAVVTAGFLVLTRTS